MVKYEDNYNVFDTLGFPALVEGNAAAKQGLQRTKCISKRHDSHNQDGYDAVECWFRDLLHYSTNFESRILTNRTHFLI